MKRRKCVGAGRACPEPVEAARELLGRGPLRQAQDRHAPLLQTNQTVCPNENLNSLKL